MGDIHPDFERDPGEVSEDGTVFRYGLDREITTNLLSADGKPVFNGGSFSVTNEENFNQWYRDIEGANQSKPLVMNLTKDSDGIYFYQNTDFFPLDGQLIGNQGRNHNYHFTYEIESEFTYNGGETFDFSGDDDVWVYLNGYEAIDIGGVHSREDASVNLDEVAAEAGLEIGSTYSFHFFFAERHTTKSNFIIETTLALESALCRLKLKFNYKKAIV